MGIALELISVPFAILLTVVAFVVFSDATLGGVVVWSGLFALLIYTFVKFLRFAKTEEPPRDF